MAQKIVIKKSEIEGSGVFARQAITKGETIFILKGSLVHWIVKDQKTSLAGVRHQR
jgi:SET domain-containing protein